jgi:DNA-binding XRE family transcriptional regulator
MTKDDSKKFYAELGERIRRSRERDEHGMTQEELGRRVKLSRTSIVNIEKGRQHLAAHQVYIFAAALKVRPEALLPSQGEDGSFVARKLPADVDKAIFKWAEKLG